jgi:hypothetical protein
MKGDLVKSALFPLFGSRQPKCPAFAIKRGTLTAQVFLAADLNESIHDLHPCV